jgi:raffinose/stachyose/melibiose transport system permease protein
MNKNIKKNLISIFTWIAAITFILPFIISIIMAVRSPEETMESVIGLPTHFHIENFIEAFQVMDFTVAFRNSLFLTIVSTILITICSAMAGYAIARNPKVRYMKAFDTMLIMAMMLPFHVIMIPIYRIMKNLDLLNNLLGASAIIVGMALPFATFLYVGYFKSVPMELEEAAKIDGCSAHRTFWQIVFPLVKPITATIISLEMMWTWNEFNVSLIMLQKEEVKTIPIKQFYFFGQYGSKMNMAFAAAILAMVPVILFFVFSQKFIQRGLVDGAVKG